MLAGKADRPSGPDGTERQPCDAVVYIGGYPVMQSAVEVLSALGAGGRVTLRAKGSSIPNAVAVANIVTEKMLGGSRVRGIHLDTDAAAGIGRMTSTIEIVLYRTATA